MTIMIKKRNGRKEVLDITKIQKMTIEATAGLEGVSQSELELDSHIKFIDGMNSSDIQDALIKTAVEKIDIDVPNWTFVAARLFLYDLYHRVGIATYGVKGEAYRHLKEYINFGIEAGRIIPNLANGYDLDDLNSYIDPSRDFLFNYLGIKTLYDRYLIKNSKGEPIELPQQMFMAIAMFLAQNEEKKQEKAKEFYDVISKFEVMLATPTLSNARTNRHQLSSCYIGSSPDNIEGIFDGYKEMALLSKYGGGIGWDWNQIRSLGGSIDGHKSAAGGTVPFLKITNEIVRTAANTKDFAKMFRRSYSEELNTNTILEYTIPLLKSALLSTKTAISIIDEQEHSKVEEKYQRVIVEESKTDDLYLMIEKNILKLITQKLDLSKEYFDLLSSLRRLEKIADRSVSIASLLQFAKLGGDIVQS